MRELEKFVERISALYTRPLDIEGARDIINEINKFLYTYNSNLGFVSELGQDFPYFSAFHKFWHQYHKEILDLQISNEACEKVADALYDVYFEDVLVATDIEALKNLTAYAYNGIKYICYNFFNYA